MIATPERDPRTQEIAWHKPVGRAVEDFQPIACGGDDEGIVMPWPKRDVPLNFDAPGERWCDECLRIIRAKKATS